jgi:Tfp pilus assembly protein PilN
MRPVNLIPPDARRGDRAAMRTGSAPYVVIAALGIALLATIALAFTSKQVSDRKQKVAELQQEEQQTAAKAQSLKSFTDFRAVQETRAATVASLAQSRFDWQRVLNELSRVIPPDVWLTQLEGTASPDVNVDGGADVSMRDSVAGPALSIVGCAPSQDAVAGFVADLEDIDGVTRVGVQSSERGDTTSGTSGATSGSTSDSASSASQDCRTRDFILRFEIVVAFDSVPAPATATSAPSVPSSIAPSTGTTAAAATQPASAPAGG